MYPRPFIFQTTELPITDHIKIGFSSIWFCTTHYFLQMVLGSKTWEKYFGVVQLVYSEL